MFWVDYYKIAILVSFESQDSVRVKKRNYPPGWMTSSSNATRRSLLVRVFCPDRFYTYFLKSRQMQNVFVTNQPYLVIRNEKDFRSMGYCLLLVLFLKVQKAPIRSPWHNFCCLRQRSLQGQLYVHGNLQFFSHLYNGGGHLKKPCILCTFVLSLNWNINIQTCFSLYMQHLILYFQYVLVFIYDQRNFKSTYN